MTFLWNALNRVIIIFSALMEIHVADQSFGIKDLVNVVAEKHGMNKTEARGVVDTILNEIGSTLKDGKVVDLTGFGSSAGKETAARTGRNPRSGEPLEIKASKLPAFSAAKKLKETVAA